MKAIEGSFRNGMDGRSAAASCLGTLLIFILLPMMDVSRPEVPVMNLRQIDHVPMVMKSAPPVTERPPLEPRPLILPRLSDPMAASAPALDIVLTADLQVSAPVLQREGDLSFDAPPALSAPDYVFDIADVEEAPVIQARAAPVYPLSAKRRGIEGVVTLLFTVDEAGYVRPDSIEVQAADPPGVFDTSARRAVEQWRFYPASNNGVPVPVSMTVDLQYQLEDAR